MNSPTIWSVSSKTLCTFGKLLGEMGRIRPVAILEEYSPTHRSIRGRWMTEFECYQDDTCIVLAWCYEFSEFVTNFISFEIDGDNVELNIVSIGDHQIYDTRRDAGFRHLTITQQCDLASRYISKNLRVTTYGTLRDPIVV